MSLNSLTHWSTPEYFIFWGLFVIALGLFGYRAGKLWRYLQLGRGWEKVTHFTGRIKAFILHFLGQRCQFKTLTKQDISGLGHILMAWSFFIFVFYYLLFIIIGAGFGISETMEGSRFYYYYSYIMDVLAPLVVLAALWGITRRYIIKPRRLKNEQTFEMAVILVTVCLHPITHLFKQATAITLGHIPGSLPVSGLLSHLFAGSTSDYVRNANAAFFWAHWGIVLFVLVFIAYSRYLHMITAPLNIFLRSTRSQGALESIDFTVVEAFGAADITDLSDKQLLESFACVSCGRCQEVCPAYITDKPLNPKKVIQDIKSQVFRVGRENVTERHSSQALVGDVITRDEIWACTTCGACLEICPVGNEHPRTIVDLRRRLVYEGVYDSGHRKALQKVSRDYNPWGIRWINRSKNIAIDEAKKEEKYDCIYWIGCVAAFDERVKEVVKATANIMKAAGLKFAMLGTKEKCCGDFARRLGDEGLFQKLATENIETLRGYHFDFILTHCPHCYNTLKNEYPDFRGDFKVTHHTQLISELLEAGKIHLQELDVNYLGKVIYHDPCYLGRYNGVYDEPRQILHKMYGSILEFPRNRNNSFCCGAGGGNVWKEQETGAQMSVTRLEEALKVAPQEMATACPFCLLMFQEAIQIKGVQDKIRLRDIAEIIDSFRY